MSANEYMSLVNAYKSTTGHAIFWHIHSVTVSHGLFLGNHDELVKKLTAHAAVAHLYQRGHHDEMQSEFREIMRLIHNYVAAVKSLVDHTRRIAKKLDSQVAEDIWSKYEQRKDAEFKDDPLTTFLHDLRNYLLHVSHPPVKLAMRFSQNSIGSVGIELSPQELLHWKEWRKPSLEFIEGYKDGIPLVKVVTDYEAKVYHFYNWLIDHFNNACESELQEFWAKHHEWADFCKRNGIPVSDEEWREYIESEKRA